MKKTSEDVFRVNITSPSDTFPSVQISVHKYGIKEPDRIASQAVAATKDKSKDEIAKEIGLEIIKNSRVLKAWFKENKK
ncbi:MAG TPA: hypothetical protein VKF36_17175 [Syntrophorhabdales bacterium]|nr:hypothetical protein [Syntrophorhabdales bacterium]